MLERLEQKGVYSMATELHRILKKYQAFEAVVRPQIENLCGQHCSICNSVCCRPDYCRENLDSPFLARLRSKNPSKSGYNAAQGWLTPTGCALSNGRPPVCYQFTCDKIIDALPDDLNRYLALVLSNLVPHIGKRALGDRHLVEIMDPAHLKKVKHERFVIRLGEARKALRVIESFKRQGFLPASARPILSRITPSAPSQ